MTAFVADDMSSTFIFPSSKSSFRTIPFSLLFSNLSNLLNISLVFNALDVPLLPFALLKPLLFLLSKISAVFWVFEALLADSSSSPPAFFVFAVKENTLVFFTPNFEVVAARTAHLHVVFGHSAQRNVQFYLNLYFI